MSLTSDGRHAQPSWWGRRSRKGKVGILATILLVVGGVAYALIFLIGAVTGTIQGANYDVELLDATTVAPDQSCTVVADTVEDDVEVTWTDALDGDRCQIAATWAPAAGNTGELRYQSFEIAGPEVVAYLPSTAHTQCIGGGKVVNSTTQLVILEWQGNGSSFTFAPGDGYNFVRTADFDTGLCNPVAP